MKSRIRLLLAVIWLTPVVSGQKLLAQARTMALNFTPMWGQAPLQLGRYYKTDNNDSLYVSLFRCYVSDIVLMDGGKAVWAEADSYHLLDADDSSSLHLVMAVPTDVHYNNIRFNLGIDSPTNARGAQGGALDATKAMYWAWQSGYINCKLEGSSPVCPTRKHIFQFHLGGFQGKDYCAQEVKLPMTAELPADIGIDISRFFSGLDLAKTPEVMTPGGAAVTLSAKAAEMFYIVPVK